MTEGMEKNLRDKGWRITRQRRIILDILDNRRDYPDALAIFQRAKELDPSISLSTIYRTLKALEEKGSVERHSFSGGPARFESRQEDHHDHLIDIDTGEVIEFYSELIEQLQHEIADRLGYDIIYHRFELYGKKHSRKLHRKAANNAHLNGSNIKALKNTS